MLERKVILNERSGDSYKGSNAGNSNLFYEHFQAAMRVMQSFKINDN